MVFVLDPSNGIATIGQTVAQISSSAAGLFQRLGHFIGQHALGVSVATPFIALFGIVIAIFRSPLEFLVMVLGGIIISIIYVVYKVFAYQPLIWIPFAIWFLLTKIIFLILYTIVIGVVVAFICLFLLIIAVLNHISGNALKNLVLCQNSPLSWYQTANYHLGNKFERSLFCKSACAPGYYPDDLTGEFCNRLGQGQPSFCPQAEVMRIFSNFNRNDMRHVYDNFNPTTHFFFNFLTPEQKEREYKQYYIKRQSFFSKCKNALGNYEPVTLDICANLDMLKANGYNGLTDKDIRKLEEVCSQGFCDSKSRYFFCGKFNPTTNTTDVSQLVKHIALFLILGTIFIFILTLTYNFVKAL